MGITDTLMPILDNVENVVDCQKINASYRELVHNFACDDLPITFGWIFSCVIMYGFFGMLLFTFRGALFPSVAHDEYGEIMDEQYEDNYDIDPLQRGRDKDDNMKSNSSIACEEEGQRTSTFKGVPAKTGYEGESLMMDPARARSTDTDTSTP